MIGFRLSMQRPPEPNPVAEGVVMRFERVFEVAPEKMQAHMQQQDFPAWETTRIVSGRRDHLEWMHRHFADSKLSGEELLAELAKD